MDRKTPSLNPKDSSDLSQRITVMMMMVMETHTHTYLLLFFSQSKKPPRASKYATKTPRRANTPPRAGIRRRGQAHQAALKRAAISGTHAAN